MDLRDAILQASDIKTEKMKVPEWKVTIGIKEATMKEANDARKISEVDGEVDTDKLTIEMFLTCVVTPGTSDPIFKREDIKALEGKGFEVMDRVMTAIMKLNGQGEPELKAAVKN